MEAIEDEAGLLAEVKSRNQTKSVRMVGGYLMIPTDGVALGYYGEPQSKFFFMDDYLIGEELTVSFDEVELRPKKLVVSGKAKSGGGKKSTGAKSTSSAKSKASSKNARKMAMLRLMLGNKH